MDQVVLLAASEGANPLIPNVWEILVTGISFAILMFIVVKFVVPAFEKTYAERTEAIEGDMRAGLQHFNRLYDFLFIQEGDAELTVDMRSNNILMRMCFNSRIHPQ